MERPHSQPDNYEESDWDSPTEGDLERAKRNTGSLKKLPSTSGKADVQTAKTKTKKSQKRRRNGSVGEDDNFDPTYATVDKNGKLSVEFRNKRSVSPTPNPRRGNQDASANRYFIPTAESGEITLEVPSSTVAADRKITSPPASRSMEIVVSKPEPYSYRSENNSGNFGKTSSNSHYYNAATGDHHDDDDSESVRIEVWRVHPVKMEPIAAKTELVLRRWVREVMTVVGIVFTVISVILVEFLRIIFLKLLWPLLKLCRFICQLILSQVFELLLFITTSFRRSWDPCVDLAAAYAVRACVPIAEACQCFRINVTNG